MRTYQLLLVDDEVEITQRIQSRIPSNLGFEVVGTASNGYDALEMIEKYHPDAVITDIKMPYIDGIELAKIIRSQYPKTKIAFISGYDEFAYAKEAISLDVVSYLSKPIGTDELNTFLERLRARLDEEHQALFNQEQLDDMFSQNRQALLENQFNSLLHAANIQESELTRFKVFGVDLSHGYFTTGIIEIDAIADFYEVEYLRIFLVNLLNKKFKDVKAVYTVNSGFGLVFIIHQEKADSKEIENRLYEVLLTKKEYSTIKIQIGVSERFDEFRDFPKSVLQAKKALSLSQYMNVGSIIHHKDILNKKKVDLKLSKQEIETIQYVIKFGSVSEIDHLFNTLSQDDAYHREYLLNNQYYLVNLSHIFIDFANSLNIELESVLDMNLFEKLKSFEDLHAIFSYLKALVLKLRELNVQKSQNNVNDVFAEALAYVESHYPEADLSMDSVCEQLGISVSYLSTLFKKGMDSSFNKVLIKFRMEKAQELLKFSSKKIYEIAQEVGYNDVYYFSYSFKKFTGMSPKDFRHEQKN